MTTASGKRFSWTVYGGRVTGTWISEPAYPQPDWPKKFPALMVSVGTLTGRPQSFRVLYDWDRQEWESPPKRDVVAGLAVYARYDGSFEIWDPARPDSAQNTASARPPLSAVARGSMERSSLANTVRSRLQRSNRRLGALASWRRPLRPAVRGASQRFENPVAFREGAVNGR